MLTLLDHLLHLFPTAKRTTLRQMISAGRVRINGQRARTLNQPISESDQVKVADQPPGPAPRRPRLDLPIVHEDEDLLIIDKPAGLLTSTVPREKRPTALAMIREYVKATNPRAQVGLIHRLDRDASGLLVFSKNHDAYLSLKQQFKDHSVERIYLALVHGVPTPQKGTIDSLLVERANGTVRPTDNPKRGERAVSKYELIARTKHHSLLRVQLLTGKKHQIRVHLGQRAVPIVNDPLYGEQKPEGRLMLAATELGFIHPRTGKPVHYRVDPPQGVALPPLA